MGEWGKKRLRSNHCHENSSLTSKDRRDGVFDWEIWTWIFEIRIERHEIWKRISTQISLSLVFLSSFFFEFWIFFFRQGGGGGGCGDRGYEKRYELFLREQLSRTRTHNKQKKKHCPRFSNYNGIKDTHKVMIWWKISRGVRVKSVLHFAFDCQI